MKILTKEEEQAHYSAVVKNGFIGGALGMGLGVGALWLGARRYPAVRNLTIQFRAFLATSASTAGAIIMAERASIAFGKAQHPMNFYKDESQRELADARRLETGERRVLDWARDNRYTIVGTSWIAAIAIALTLVGRNKFLTTSQKVVQARVYAQGLTLAVLLATGALEMGDAKSGKGRWETVMVLDPNDPEHKHLIEKRIHHEEYAGQDLWRDMVEAEERRLARQKQEKKADAQPQNSKVGAPAQ